MSGKLYWNIAMAVFVLLVATTVYASADFEDTGGSLAISLDRENIVQQQQPPTETATPSIGEAAIVPGTTYTVQRGDTLGEISRKAYGSPRYWSAICNLNSLSDCGRIEVGDALTIPTIEQADAIISGTPTAGSTQTELPVQVPTEIPVPQPDVTVPTGWSAIVNERLGYSFAVPRGWQIVDLQSGQLGQILRSMNPTAAQQLDDALSGPGGEYMGHLAIELVIFSSSPIAALAGVGIFPNLDDDISSERLVEFLERQSEILPPSMPLEVKSLEAGTTNNLPSIQGVAIFDGDSLGFFKAHVVITVLRANDTAFILMVAVPVNQVRNRQLEIDQIIGTFRPEAETATATGVSTTVPTLVPTATQAKTPTPIPSPTPTATFTPTPSVTMFRAINIRRGPGTSYGVVGTASAGEQYTVTGRNAAGDWWQISYNGKRAWVYAPLVESEATDDVRAVSAPPTATRTPTPKPSPTATRTRTPTPRPTAPPVLPGTHRVGVDIRPGLYIGLAGQGIWNSCYWERLKDLSGTLDSIIANENAEGLFYVEILPSDRAFSTDCEVRAIGEIPPPSSPLTKLPPGMYLVGRDILPGLYRGQAPRGDWCYWERLSSATGDFYSILANDNAEGQYFVSVAPSDFAVRFRCPVERVE